MCSRNASPNPCATPPWICPSTIIGLMITPQSSTSTSFSIFVSPGLQETVFFDPKREAWGFGAHVALVKIDRDTGETKIEKLVLVDDCGVIINPMIVEGQIHGGVAQGLGEAFLEHMQYGED